ncbi:hypothetical protein [Amycolatopsis nigrescens]|uniref:hypothetical protein n=1 Tax=Amycolatopsis nigrescens TaxID=381445 RepID=UPI00037657F9|nr:hypothetical protein [Amycolatopsis nigrescens]
MTARTRSSSEEPSRSDPRTLDTEELGSPAPKLTAAFALGGAAAVLSAAGALFPAIAGAAPGFASAPVLILLAVLPIAVVAGLALRGQRPAAAGVLAGTAAVAVGRIVLDLQFLFDASAAARPELHRPVSLGQSPAAAGLWLTLAGELCAVLAGVLAVQAVQSNADPGESGAAAEPGTRGRVLVAVVAGVLAGFGLTMAPFGSTDAYLLSVSVFEAPAFTLAGYLLMACALPVVAALSASSATPGLAKGGLLGAAVAAVVVALPNLLSGLLVPDLSLSTGPVLTLAGAVALAALAFRPADARADAMANGSHESGDGSRDGTEAVMPGQRRLRLVTGLLGLLTAVAALAGALAPQVVAAGGTAGPQSPARWLLLAAGLVVGVLGVALLVPGLASVVRPAMSVCWAGVPLAGAAVLDTVVKATELGPAFTAGSGALWAALALAFAAATACCSVVAGMVEREDAEEDGAVPGPNVLTPLVAAGILAAGAFGVPSIAAPDYVAPTLLTNFGTPSWGLLLALCTVLGAIALTPRSRPPAAVALLLGAAVVTGLRLVELPLAGGMIDGAGPATGWWLALGSVLALLIAAVLAARPARSAA